MSTGWKTCGVRGPGTTKVPEGLLSPGWYWCLPFECQLMTSLQAPAVARSLPSLSKMSWSPGSAGRASPSATGMGGLRHSAQPGWHSQQEHAWHGLAAPPVINAAQPHLRCHSGEMQEHSRGMLDALCHSLPGITLLAAVTPRV